MLENKNSKWSFTTGLGLGLLIGAGMLVGSLVTIRHFEEPTIQINGVQATASNSSETFAVATGPLSDGTEGAFFLDFITGELQVIGFNPRANAFGAHFKRNVFADLAVQPSKKPRLLMVTGQVSFLGSSNTKPADSVVYVVDSATGNFAAYGIPFNRQAQATGAAQAGALVLIHRGSARNLNLNE